MRQSAVWCACLCAAVAFPPAFARAADHPLEPLSALEIQAAFTAVKVHFKADAALPDEPLRYSLVALAEPAKSFVLGWKSGTPFPRKARVQILHYPSNRAWVAEVDLRLQKKNVTLQALAAGTQPAMTSDEFVAADALVHAYEPFQRAIRARGLDPDLAYVDVWAPGDAELPAEIAAGLPSGQRTRLARCLVFYRGASAEDQVPELPQNPYDRPIEGIVLTVDLNARRVIEMVDIGARPVSSESDNAKTSRKLKPLVVSQPEGSDLAIEGHLVRWYRPQFYAVLHPREGLVLYDVRFRGRRRVAADRLPARAVGDLRAVRHGRCELALAQRVRRRWATSRTRSASPDGVSVYSAPAEPLHGDDLVLWYTTGFTHLSKPEDYPVMPTETSHFELQPRGFFEANPALEIGDQAQP